MVRVLPIALIMCFASLTIRRLEGADTLQSAWREAVAANAELLAADLDRAAAYEDMASAKTGRLPKVWLRGSYSLRSDERNFRLNNPFDPGQQVIAPYAQRDAAGAAANVEIPLYTGGAIKNLIAGAEARLAAATHGCAASRTDLLLAVSEAYMSVLRAERELMVAEQNLASLQAHQAEVQKHFALQQVPRSELLAAQVAAAEAQQIHLRRLHLLEVARGEYNRLLGRPLESPVILEELTIAPIDRSLEELQQIAFERREDLAQLHASIDARLFEAERLRAAGRPHLSATGRHDFEENRYQTPQGISTAAVVIDWNIYDGGKSRHAAAAEQNRAASLRKLAEDLKSRIALDIRTQRSSQFEALSRLGVAAEAVSHSEENLRVSKLRYAQGMAVSSEVLDVQAHHSQAASDFYNARYDACWASIRLRRAAGILEVTN